MNTKREIQRIKAMRREIARQLALTTDPNVKFDLAQRMVELMSLLLMQMDDLLAQQERDIAAERLSKRYKS